MKAPCTITRMPDGTWQARCSDSTLGDVHITAPSREEVLRKMQNELQYRLELCPCSGEVMGTIELQISESTASDR